ncbi:MAG TPA: DUF2382 domain-containing protein [Gemmatimonadaceae bacterium]|nr:DUF2382 domain-containing protein [Gemmatimonadaceae bacterium]
MAKDYDMDEQRREHDRQRPSDNPQVAALKDLGDYEVAEGYPDPRGWTVRSADGTDVGKVHDLIVDTGSMRTRYLAVRLDDDFGGSRNDRDVLIPIGTARIDDDGDNVVVNNLSADRFATLPAYEAGSLTRDQELELRRQFTSGDAMSAGTIGAGATGGSDFYDHDHFNDRGFFTRGRDRDVRDDAELARQRMEEADRLTVSEEQLSVGKRQVPAGEVGVRKNVETRHVEQEVPLTREEVTVERRPLNADAANTGDIRINDGEIRVPVMREEAVVEKRLVPTEEIIIRKTAVRDTETVGADLRRERVEVDKNSTARVRDEDRRDMR